MYLGGERVMEIIVYAEASDDCVTFKDIVGESRTFRGAVIAEMSVSATRLVPERT